MPYKKQKTINAITGNVRLLSYILDVKNNLKYKTATVTIKCSQYNNVLKNNSTSQTHHIITSHRIASSTLKNIKYQHHYLLPPHRLVNVRIFPVNKNARNTAPKTSSLFCTIHYEKYRHNYSLIWLVGWLVGFWQSSFPLTYVYVCVLCFFFGWRGRGGREQIPSRQVESV